MSEGKLSSNTNDRALDTPVLPSILTPWFYCPWHGRPSLPRYRKWTFSCFPVGQRDVIKATQPWEGQQARQTATRKEEEKRREMGKEKWQDRLPARVYKRGKLPF